MSARARLDAYIKQHVDHDPEFPARLDAFAAEVRAEQAAEIDRLRAELGATKDRTQKLVDGWKQASEDHAKFAESKVMTAELSAKQEGRSLQLLDCADELADVLKGEDPDDWEHGIGLDVIERDERVAKGGA